METKVCLIESREEISRLRRINILLILVTVFSTTVAVLSLTLYLRTSGKISTLENENLNLECDLTTERLNNDGIYKEYEEMVVYTKQCETTITALYTMVETLDEQNLSLVESNNDYYEKILQYQEREELFDKYEYCITREDGTRTDLTYDQIANVEELCEQLDVDTDLVLSIVMVESQGTEDATSTISTARGYGQFLKSSAEYVYEEIMDAGEYYHDYAYDGDTNLTMIVYYLNYLYRIYGGDLYSAIKQYRGESGTTLYNYIYRIDQYLKEAGTSFEYLDSMA